MDETRELELGIDEPEALESSDQARPRRKALARLLLAALAIPPAALVLRACVDDNDGVDGQGGGATAATSAPEQTPPGWDVIAEAPRLGPALEDRRALWGSGSEGAMRSVTGAAFRGDTIIMRGSDGAGTVLAAVDAATGARRWSVVPTEQLLGGTGAVSWDLTAGSQQTPAIVDQAGNGWAVLVEYYLDVPCADPGGECQDELGVAALSSEDGHVLWKRPVVPAQPSESLGPRQPLVREMIVDGGTAVAVIDPSETDAPQGNAHTETLRAVAIDTASGELRWERDAMLPVAVGADTVLGLVPSGASGPGEPSSSSTQSLIALDASTGEQRWRLPRPLASGGVLLAAGDVALVEVAKDASSAAPVEIVVVELTTGREITRVRTSFNTECASDQRSWIACGITAGQDAHLVTFRLDGSKAKVSDRAIVSQFVDGVWQEHVFVSNGRVGTSISVDRSGNTIDERLPGKFVAASERYLIFASFDGQAGYPGYTVYGME